MSRLRERGGTRAAVVLAAVGAAGAVEVVDIGLETGFQDVAFGTHQRGRACVAADFDLDGRPDVFVGNPGDRSYVMRNTTGPEGQLRFQPVQVLTEGAKAFGGVAGDYDDDGDLDLFVSMGGLEGIGFDRLFENRLVDDGVLEFVDVTDRAGIAGPRSESGEVLATASAHAAWIDYDMDGDADLFVNTAIVPQTPPELSGRNTLWRNEGDGTFTDVTAAVGLDVTRMRTRNSSWLDYDNDGDYDLYENNRRGPNFFWQNLRMETGEARFVDVTDRLSIDVDLHFPIFSFASATVDLNNDGWQDLVVFNLLDDFSGNDCMVPEPPAPGAADGQPVDPLGDNHALLLNLGGRGIEGFVNVTGPTGLGRYPLPPNAGVMGCQVGDINADGYPDLYAGNGSMFLTTIDQLYITSGTARFDHPVGGSFVLPKFDNFTRWIDFPAPSPRGTDVAPYPYRTHGVCLTDFDRDGLLEAGVVNGGPAALSDHVREPNRLFDFRFPDERPHSLRVVLRGGGQRVTRDALGARLRLRVSEGNGPVRELHQTVLSGSAFSAQNGYELFFGLGQADTLHGLDVVWPDGRRQTVADELALDGVVTISYPAP